MRLEPWVPVTVTIRNVSLAAETRFPRGFALHLTHEPGDATKIELVRCTPASLAPKD